MSSFKKVMPQKVYKERTQIKGRKNLGPLEKHKDYQIRSRKKHQKDAKIKLLKEKVMNKNPDEYYVEMKNSKKKEGKVFIDKISKDSSKMEKRLLETTSKTNLSLLNMKRQIELNNIEKLKNELHFLGQEKKSNHKIFVKSKKELNEFNAEKYFDTHSSLGNSNLKLKTNDLFNIDLKEEMKSVDSETLKKYKKLEKHIQNEKILSDAINDLELNSNLILKKKEIQKLYQNNEIENPNLNKKYKNVVSVQFKNERKK
eukprot:gene4345-7701_t